MNYWKLVLLFGLIFAAAPPGVAAGGPKSEWTLARGREATVLVENRSSEEAWVRLELIPSRHSGVVSPPLRLQPGQQMEFNLRYFVTERPGEEARGRLKARHSGRHGAVSVTVLAEQEEAGTLYQVGSNQAEVFRDETNRCEAFGACDDLDPDYVLHDRFEYREWDVDGDGISDPDRRSSFVVFDSTGAITWAESLYSTLQPVGSPPPIHHDEFCSEQVSGRCITERCSIVEYQNDIETGVPQVVGHDFITTTYCPDEAPDVEVFGGAVSLDAPELFYGGCVQSAALHFSHAMDDEVADAKADLVEILNDLRGIVVAASGITIGGLLNDPMKMVGKIVRNAPGFQVIWNELRAIRRGYQAQMTIREQACGLVTAERICFERTQEAFGSVQLRRHDVYGVLSAKGINADVVRRHCKQ